MHRRNILDKNTQERNFMMGAKSFSPKGLEVLVEKRIEAIWSNLFMNRLWQRMLKNTIATTIAIILALIPGVVAVYGQATYLAAIVTVFGHPGRRFGMMAEALVLAVSGTLVGIGWSTFGIYLSSLIYHTNPPAAYTIKGIFLAIALMFHGFLRSHTPRLWIFVLLQIIVSVVGLTGTSTAVTASLVTVVLYPILTAVAVLLLVNTLVFPEFSSSFLGVTTIETLGDTVAALRDAGKYFVHIPETKEEKMHENATDVKSKPNSESPKAPEKWPENAEPSLFHKLIEYLKKNKGEEKVNSGSLEAAPKKVQLKTLTDAKSQLRAKLASCKAAQTECNFELTWAVLPPRDLKPISDTQMRKLVANTIALIGACESRYALMGDEDDEKESINEQQLNDIANASNAGPGSESSHHGTPDDSSDEDETSKQEKKRSRRKRKTLLEKEREDLELVKPRKEIASGDVELLKFLVAQISKPLADIQEKIDESVNVVTSCLAYCYDVEKLPSGARAPTGIRLEEIDIRVDYLKTAMATFDRDSAQALESAAALHGLDHPQIDIMPRMETFLISSFLLNLRQAALHTLEMLYHSRAIVEKRQARHERRRLYAPRINWRKWLISGGEEDSLALPESGRKDIRTGKRKEDDADNDSGSVDSSDKLLTKKDVESAPAENLGSNTSRSIPRATQDCNDTDADSRLEKATISHRLRNGLADIIESVASSEDLLYALKLTIAVFLVAWPAFVAKWNSWFSFNRGLWAALQLVLITEVAIGTSVVTFTLRAFGTTLGCLWGWAAYEARDGNRIVCVVVLIVGIIPSTYIQLGSKYPKAGMVSIVSMCIVALAIEDQTTPRDSPTATFLRRFLAFLIGGIVALIVEVALFPVKARDRLVESLASSVLAISEMEACLAFGIETETNVDVHSAEVQARFDRAKGKASGALTAAETFLPFCANEPRLKGSFKGLALVYAEVLYVLHAVVDRMDNMLHLRHEYGSGVLEELNEKVYPYRRNVAASITIVLFAVHEALTTKLPLPQFLPSARLAHLRMVNRVREVVVAGNIHKHTQSERSEIEMSMVKRVVRQKFLSWNAASAGQIEVIEYLEELIDLVKLLVGANEFRSGLLTRPTYREYADHTDQLFGTGELDGVHDATYQTKDNPRNDEQDELRDTMPEPEKKAALARRRTTFSRHPENMERLQKKKSEDDEFEKQKQAMEEELPRSLQRVRSRRIEELHLKKTRSREDSAKGKGKKLS